MPQFGQDNYGTRSNYSVSNQIVMECKLKLVRSFGIKAPME
jgi:hypothetical protein